VYGGRNEAVGAPEAAFECVRLGARVFALLSVNPFVEQVIPLLQQRGVARADYAGTMRDHLQEF
jgi:hypothetical protein